MTRWPRMRLDECCEIVSGATPRTSVAAYWDGDILWATPKDLSDLDGAYLLDTPRKITRAGLESCAATVLPAGSVLFSSRAPIGHVAVNMVPMTTNQGFKSLVPRPERLDAKFLYWWLRTNRTYLEGLGNGATFKEVSKAVVSRVEIPIPPLPEQRRIAHVLDHVEALRVKRRAALAQLDALTHAIFLEMFGDPSSSTNCVPTESLGDHLLFITSGGRGWAKFYSPKGSRFIRSLDVQMNRVGNEDMVFVVPPENAEARRTRAITGDVLLTITGSRIGRVAPLPPELDGSYVSQHVAILRANHQCIDPSFLSFFLSLEAGGQRQIAKAQYGQTKPGLNFEQIKRLSIPVPPLSLQVVFARRVAAVVNVKRAYGASLAELDALFGSLEYHAFRGEL